MHERFAWNVNLGQIAGLDVEAVANIERPTAHLSKIQLGAALDIWQFGSDELGSWENVGNFKGPDNVWIRVI